MYSKKNIFKYSLVFLVLIFCLLVYKQKDNFFVWMQKNTLPTPISYQRLEATNNYLRADKKVLVDNSSNSRAIEINELPLEMNLQVPFILQAPGGNWIEPYKEACEEASLQMVVGYFASQVSYSQEETKKQIDDLIDFQIKTIGVHKDLNIYETATLAENFFHLQTRIIKDLNIEKIKKELSQGNPVIVPAAGQLLGNPYFRQPGPVYHMLVIKGYLNNDFITNDPGTKHGESFLYNQEKLMSAIADWTDEGPIGGKVGLILNIDKQNN